MLPITLTSLLVFLSGIFTDIGFVEGKVGATAHPLQFQLRQLHAVSRFAHVAFSDVQPRTVDIHPKELNSDSYTIQPRKVTSFRPRSFQEFLEARTRPLFLGQSEPFRWDEEETIGPDVESRETLLELAKMTNNAYVSPNDPEWYDLGKGWKDSYPFGWEPDADGFRGHVFATPDNKTVILSIKGTSAGVFGGGGPTAKKDKFNDNLLFSCCCARIDWTWTTVCGCYRGGWKCDTECLDKALIEESLFYPIGTVSRYD
ncbi:hypothetical protein C0992_000645 [Termitomyces sp. T32_za158]|nr:hypothetical protein C0992_000645 [Termitomyces sp. T32_za158]